MPDAFCPYPCRIVIAALFVQILLMGSTTPAAAQLFDADLPRETKVRNLNLIGAGTIITWGVVNWDYFQKSPHSKSEHWFSKSTDEGGADKLGHLYSAYVLSRVYASIYHRWDYPEDQAMRLGALSALGTTGIVELGDSFSDYGFSYEDMVMNCVGVAAGYFLGTYPDWQQRIDLRMEYAPSLKHSEGDLSTDYEHFKFLLALKADAFTALNDTPLRYLELHLGYYVREDNDYHPTQEDDLERTVYLGIGLNVGKLLATVWETKLFNYVQLPYTYLPIEYSLDD